MELAEKTASFNSFSSRPKAGTESALEELRSGESFAQAAKQLSRIAGRSTVVVRTIRTSRPEGIANRERWES
jgi:hypothetical protein